MIDLISAYKSQALADPKHTLFQMQGVVYVISGDYSYCVGEWCDYGTWGWEDVWGAMYGHSKD